MFSIDAETWLENVLERDEKLSSLFDDEDDAVEHLESLGYELKTHDNTYNQESDLDEVYDYKVYDLKESPDYVYSETAIVLVRLHVGLDVRAGYSYVGAYRGSKWEGLTHFYCDRKVSLRVLDGEDEVDEFESAYYLTEEYELVSYEEKNQKIIVQKDGKKFSVDWWNPVYGC